MVISMDNEVTYNRRGMSVRQRLGQDVGEDPPGPGGGDGIWNWTG